MTELREIDIEEAKQIAERKGLVPGRVKGTDQVRFTSGNNERLEVIDWSDFAATVARRKIAVYESGGWMKLMRKR